MDASQPLLDSHRGEPQSKSQRVAELNRRMLKILPKLFPPDVKETTVFCPLELDGNTVLVDYYGDITALVDIEFSATRPLWHACQPPRFLNPHGPDEEPDPEGQEPDDEFYADMRMNESQLPGLLLRADAGAPAWLGRDL